MMRFPNYKFLLGVAAGLVICSQSAFARTWTDTKRRSLEAEIVSKTEKTVDLELVNGKTVTVQLETLSKKDQEFVTQWKVTAGRKAVPEEGKRGADDYFSAEWPRLISADVGMDIEEGQGSEGEFIYKSPHYEFICNAELSKSVVKRFALLFEATYLYMKALPLGNSKAHAENGKRYKIYLFETMEQYHRAGGPRGSAGVFMGGRRQIIMVPFPSLGLIKGSSSWRVDYNKTNKTLPHEITHQITDVEYFNSGCMGWYTEGLAEYVAATPYRSGKFSVNSADRAVEEYVTGFSRKGGRGRNLGVDINAPDLKAFMDQPYSSFAGANGNFNYGLGALLVTYFCHYDGDGDASNLKNFLMSMKAGEQGDEAQKELLAGRTWDQLETDIAKEWSRRGVKIKFK